MITWNISGKWFGLLQYWAPCISMRSQGRMFCLLFKIPSSSYWSWAKADYFFVFRDTWSLDESIYFFQQVLELEKEEGFEGRIYHETHRSRSFFTPFATEHILQKVPGYVFFTFPFQEAGLLTPLIDYGSLQTFHTGPVSVRGCWSAKMNKSFLRVLFHTYVS